MKVFVLKWLLAVDLERITKVVTKLLNWEKEFETKFDCDFHNKDIIRIQCTVCGMWEKQINLIKNFSYDFTRPGTISVKKDTIKIHCLSEPHKVATNREQKSKMGAQPYLQSVSRYPSWKGYKKKVWQR